MTNREQDVLIYELDKAIQDIREKDRQIAELLAIIEKAKRVCRWVGWMENGNNSGASVVRELKAEIERYTGKEIVELT